MKIVSVLLVSILIFSGLFYTIFLNISLIKAKLDASEKIFLQSTKEKLTLIKIPSKNAERIGEKEILYEGKRYDIATSSDKNDTTYYYVLEDHEEERALDEIYQYFNERFYLISPISLHLAHPKRSVKGLDQLYSFYLSVDKTNQNFSEFPFNELNKSYFLEPQTVLTPPPELL